MTAKREWQHVGLKSLEVIAMGSETQTTTPRRLRTHCRNDSLTKFPAVLVNVMLAAADKTFLTRIKPYSYSGKSTGN